MILNIKMIIVFLLNINFFNLIINNSYFLKKNQINLKVNLLFGVNKDFKNNFNDDLKNSFNDVIS